jgi:hypothetical protein
MCCASRSSRTKAAAPIIGDRESAAEILDAVSPDAVVRNIEITKLPDGPSKIDDMFSARNFLPATPERAVAPGARR